MALLNFPDNPIPNQLYPYPCPAGVTQYRWDIDTRIWRIVGVATGVTEGTYGNEVTIAGITVNTQGVVTDAENIPIRAASIYSPGIVQLNDSTTSLSLSEALTARVGKVLQDQIGTLNTCIVPERDNVVSALNYLQLELNKVDIESLAWCGYYNALDGYISFVSSTGAALGYSIGSKLPTPSLLNAGNFFIVNVPGNPYIGGDANAPQDFCFNGNWILQDRSRWTKVNTGSEVIAKNVLFDSRGSCFTATNVQAALQQVCSLLRSPVGGVTVSVVKPENPYLGQLWWDSSDGSLYTYYIDSGGAQWVELNTAS